LTSGGRHVDTGHEELLKTRLSQLEHEVEEIGDTLESKINRLEQLKRSLGMDKEVIVVTDSRMVANDAYPDLLDKERPTRRGRRARGQSPVSFRSLPLVDAVTTFGLGLG
jgi:hypothetical protein